MKTGLLTFHSAHNYGAVLQAYATQEKIRELGGDIEVIQYQPGYLIQQKVFHYSPKSPFMVNAKLILEGLLTFRSRLKRKANFENFINKQLHLSHQKYGSVPFSENLAYDIFVMGSDQIWNAKLTKGLDPVYFGNFKTKTSARKITYAASMSHYGLTDGQKSEFQSLLQNFDAISVREEELEAYLENFNTKSTVVLDPTFLLDKNTWSMISRPPKTSKKYVLVYSVDLREESIRLAQSIAKEINADVIELSMAVDRQVFNNPYQKASPEEYVGLFEKAEFVVTSSFHGTAFSIIFNKPFYSIAHGNDKDSRQSTILSKLGLIDRFIDRKATPGFAPLDYNEANGKLNVLKQQSVNFLKNNLKLP